MQIDRRILHYFDWPLFVFALFIPLAGLIVLFSAGYDPDSSDYIFGFLPAVSPSPAFNKQIIFLLIGVLIAAVSVLIPTQKLSKFAYWFYAICVFSLIVVDIFGIVIKGSQRWINLGPIHFQPSEISKMGVIFALSRYLSVNPAPRGGYKLSGLVIPCLLFVIPMILILKQPDLGTAMSLAGIGFCMVCFAGINIRTFLTVFLIGLIALYPAWNHLHDYQKRRLLVLVDPESDPLGSGYHILQSKIAVGSGELSGKGFLKGTQTQLQFLPEHTTDFIFSVLAEEWGFIGCIFVLILYLLLFQRLCRVIAKSRDTFSMFLVVGMTSYIYCHVAINISMVVGLLPVVGIPLPLFSYGGSSLLSNMLAIGLALGVSLRRRMRTES